LSVGRLQAAIITRMLKNRILVFMLIFFRGIILLTD